MKTFKVGDIIFNGQNLVCKVVGLAGSEYGIPYEIKAKYMCNLSDSTAYYYHDSTEFLIVSVDHIIKITDQKTIDKINKIIIFKN